MQVGLYKISEYMTAVSSEEKLGKEGEWFVKGDVEQILERYKDWDPRLLKFLRLAKPEHCNVWNVTDLAPLVERQDCTQW